MNMEFIGLPGSGKSSIRKVLLESLRTRNDYRYISIEEAFYYSAKRVIDKPYRILLNSLPSVLSVKISKYLLNRSLYQHLSECRYLAKYGLSLSSYIESDVFSKMSYRDRELVICGLLQTGSVWEFTQEKITLDQCIVFEEGFVQKSIMFIDTSVDVSDYKNNLNIYLDNIPLPDYLIYVKVPRDICISRMKGRESGVTRRLKDVPISKMEGFLGRIDEHLRYVVHYLAKHKKVKTIELENTGDISVSTKYLIKEISPR